MPYKAHGPCTYPGCRNLSVKAGRCAVHPREPFQRTGADHALYDANRPSPSARGYDARWRAYRKQYIKAYPNCRNCGAPTTDVDHIIPVHGPDDPLFWDQSNHQPLCHPCHSRKTARESSRKGVGRVKSS